MILLDGEQGTAEWHAARTGVITASRFKDACDRLADKPGKLDQATGVTSAPTPGGFSAKCLKYAADVALERVTGRAVLGPYVNMEMRLGTEREPMARSLYESRFGVWVNEAGIALTDDRRFGYSTDGFVEDEGCIEVKCPSSADVIVSMWATNDVSDYIHQIQGGLWLTGLKWCDLVVYVPDLAVVGKELYVQRIARDEAFIADLETKLVAFLGLVNDNETALRKAPNMKDGHVIV
jgi:exodeoxyribonuclease (lambda-induced)